MMLLPARASSAGPAAVRRALRPPAVDWRLPEAAPPRARAGAGACSSSLPAASRREDWAWGCARAAAGAAAAGAASRRPARRRRDRRSGVAAAAGAAAAPPATEEELRSLRLKDLKKALATAGLDVSGCFDKESLVELLRPEGTAERVIASLQAVAEAARPKIFEAPLVVEENTYIALDLKLGPSETVARFMVDTSTPFTTILEGWAKSLGAIPVTGTNPPRVSVGKAKLGDLDCGEFRAVPVVMAVPPDCCGVLSLDFLSRFDWDLDVQNCRLKVCKAPDDASQPVPFEVSELRQVPLELKAAKNLSMGGLEIELLRAPVKMGRQGTAAAEQLLGSLGSFSVACEAYFLFASVSACSKDAATALALGGDDYPGKGKQIMTPGGQPQTFQDYPLSLAVGDGPDGPVKVNAEVCVDHPGLQKIAFAPGEPTAIVGLDVLGRSRLVFSPRLMSIWLRPELG